jgi:hypothetical protein
MEPGKTINTLHQPHRPQPGPLNIGQPQIMMTLRPVITNKNHHQPPFDATLPYRPGARSQQRPNGKVINVTPPHQ